MITLKNLKRLIVILFGMTVLLIGLVLLVLPVPGPGSIVIIAGLAILAGEFVWARWALHKVKSGMRRMNHMIRGGPSEPDAPMQSKPAGLAGDGSGPAIDREPNAAG